MKKIPLFITATLLTGISSGCNLFKYFDKKVNLYREKDEPDKQITLRYYFEQRHVPYIKVNDYYKEFFNTSLQLNKNENDYKYSLAINSYLEFNLDNNSLSCSFKSILL